MYLTILYYKRKETENTSLERLGTLVQARNLSNNPDTTDILTSNQVITSPMESLSNDDVTTVDEPTRSNKSNNLNNSDSLNSNNQVSFTKEETSSGLFVYV